MVGRKFGSHGELCLGVYLGTFLAWFAYCFALSDSVSHHMIAGMHFGNFIGPLINGSILVAAGAIYKDDCK